METKQRTNVNWRKGEDVDFMGDKVRGGRRKRAERNVKLKTETQQITTT